MKTVTAVLRGGTGNQMFQYAAAKSLAKRLGASLILDTTILRDRTPRPQITLRSFDLGLFTLTAPESSLSKAAEKLPVPLLWVGMDILGAKMRQKMGWEQEIREQEEYAFDPSLFETMAEHVRMWGYWQHPGYLRGIEEELRRDFSFKDELTGIAKERADEIQAEKHRAVALSVRKGDYVAFANVQKDMQNLGSSYYDTAIHTIQERIEHPLWFVFSDDIPWCKEHLPLGENVRWIGEEYKGNNNYGAKLNLLTRFDHAILANSTFAWWGAWLANPRGIVLMPKHWDHRGRAKLALPGWEMIG